uniref:Uncharacterized protein n=1 Tax=Tanacetum cinerariifolium TaxID=118510 RepID=A0A6L2KBX3_TANCI|nr:hypothetical protein [Tanacetum cinerariifolium]
MHNNIMATGLRDRPPMLAPGRYPQWHSQFLRYVDTRPNDEALRKCILSVETLANMSPENKAHFQAEKEAIHLILIGIGDDIYSTVDAFQTIHDMSTFNFFNNFNQNGQGKEIAKPITPPSETASEEDIDLEQAQRDKDMQKNLTLTPKYFQKIYKHTNNNIRTSSNSKKKNVDTTPQFKNGSLFGMFRNQRTVNVVTARENVGSKHKEKMLLCKQAEQGVSLQAELYDWLEDMDEDIDEQELEAHYTYMAKIQEVPTADSGTDSEPVNTCLVEMDDSNVTPNSPDMCEDDIQNEQNDVESDDERVALANLISNLKLDVDENKKIQKQLKKANTTLAQELKECKVILAETIPLLDLNKPVLPLDQNKQVDENLIDLNKPVDENLLDLNNPVDENLLDLNKPVDENLLDLNKPVDENLLDLNKPFDENLIDLNKPVDEKRKRSLVEDSYEFCVV